jgi:hypothetical protein
MLSSVFGPVGSTVTVSMVTEVSVMKVVSGYSVYSEVSVMKVVSGYSV